MSDTRRINFLIAGVQKAGTTTLDALLRAHPEINMATKKEVHFFDRAHHFRGEPNYKFYHDFFEFESGKLCGEATPKYLYLEESIERIAAYNPEMKFIIILRNPVDRAYSHWNMEFNRERETENFDNALKLEKQRLLNPTPFARSCYSYVDRGRYFQQLTTLHKLFPKENCLLLNYQHLSDNPLSLLKSVTNFLGISNLEYMDVPNLNKSQYGSKITAEQKSFILDQLQDDITSLNKLVSWDTLNWFLD